VIGAGLAVSTQQAWQRLVRPAFGERPRLAVLPFANLSPDPEDAWFADGLHEEILATLARAGACGGSRAPRCRSIAIPSAICARSLARSTSR
jgi:hypothetical protein